MLRRGGLGVDGPATGWAGGITGRGIDAAVRGRIPSLLATA